MSGPVVLLGLLVVFFLLGMLAGRSRQASSNEGYSCPVCECINCITEERDVGYQAHVGWEFKRTYACGCVIGFTGQQEALCTRETT